MLAEEDREAFVPDIFRASGQYSHVKNLLTFRLQLWQPKRQEC